MLLTLKLIEGFMTNDEVLNKVSSILGDILDIPDLKLAATTSADDVDGWDSVNHVKLIVAIEDAYKIKFATDEIAAPENVGQLIALIQKRMA
jgi:acyl carrier protein